MYNMREPKRIGLSLLDEELLTLINASAKIFPVTQDEIDNNLNPNGYEYAKVGRAIYVWEDNQWKYVIADDVDIKWEDVKNKPTKYTPSEHTHTIDEIAEGNVYTKDEIDAQLETKAPIDHNHDQFYADINHDHDDKYADKQIEEEVGDINQRLFNIENGYTEGHSHPNVEVLNNITQQQVDNWDTVVNKADKSYVDSALAGKADLTTLNGHTSNTIVHVTQTDKDYWNGKAEISDIPTSLPANGGQSDTSKGLIGDDTRDINYPPSEYMKGGSRYIGRTGCQIEFKRTAVIGVSSYLSGMYCYLETKNPWDDPSGGYPIQIAYGNGNPVWRIGTSSDSWSDWRSLGGGSSVTIGTTKPTDGSLWLELI